MRDEKGRFIKGHPVIGGGHSMPHTEESKRKISENNFLRGRKPHNWIEDRTKVKHLDERSNPVYKEWRKKVRDRDGHKCKINNNDCEGRIEVHHILSWKEHPALRYDVNNGITLCRFHHPRKRDNNQEMVVFFKKQII